MQSHKTFTKNDVAYIASLAHIPVTVPEEEALAKGFSTTMNSVEVLYGIDVSTTAPTYQVTGLENIMREDVIDTERMFTQKQALSNAPKQYNGYFMVDQVLSK